MGDIIVPGVISEMSVVIAVCSNKFCTFIADQRKIVWPDLQSQVVADEHFHKVFKINDHLMLGGAGTFRIGESICDAIGHAETIDDAFDNIYKYLDELRHHDLLTAQREYLLGGKDRDYNSWLYLIWNTIQSDTDDGHVIAEKVPCRNGRTPLLLGL